METTRRPDDEPPAVLGGAADDESWIDEWAEYYFAASRCRAGVDPRRGPVVC